MSFKALSKVFEEVAKPGRVNAKISFLSFFSILNASKHTRRAKVESNPPLIPITTFSICELYNLVAKPLACKLIISLDLASLFLSSDTTKGYFTCLGKTSETKEESSFIYLIFLISVSKEEEYLFLSLLSFSTSMIADDKPNSS